MKVVVLDESGVINSSLEEQRYFILGGIVYDLDNFEDIKSFLLPKMDLYRDLLNKEELKSHECNKRSKVNNLVYGSLLSDIQNCTHIQPILYIVDRKYAWKISTYDKKSFSYNFVLAYMIKDLITDEILEEDDEVRILVDELDFDEYNLKNFREWLPNNVKQVKSVDMGESHKYNFIQIADMIAGIPKLKGYPKQILSDHKLRLLNKCYIHVFPQGRRNDILE